MQGVVAAAMNQEVSPPAGPGAGLLPDPFDTDLRIAETLGEQGWCVTPGFLSDAQVQGLRGETLSLWEAGGFRPAAVGRGAGRQLRPSVRTDWVQWLQPDQCSALQRQCLQRLDELRSAINRTLYLGLFEYEGHLAVYPPGARYHRHLDQFLGIGSRTVTCVLYLNPDWQAADGGELRIYTDPDNGEYFQAVLPLGGTLVTFLSARFLHEVMPASRDRMSLTGWLKRRE